METKKKSFTPATSQEMRLVTKLILPHKSTLLDTRNTPEVIEAKRLAWTQITDEFNKSPIAIWSTKSLQTMWLRVKSCEKARFRRLAAEGNSEALAAVSTLFNDLIVGNMSASKVPKTQYRKKRKPEQKRFLMKRKREANFSFPEQELLLKLVKPYRSVIFSTETGNGIIDLKRAAWTRVKVAFNEAKIGPKRSKDFLKMFLRQYRYKHRATCEFNAPIDEKDYEITKAMLEPDLLTLYEASDSDDANQQESFSSKELYLLHRLVDRYKSVILSKKKYFRDLKIDAPMLKAAAWERVTKEFNGAQLGPLRDTYSLRNCWQANWQKREFTYDSPKAIEYNKITAILKQDVENRDKNEPALVRPRMRVPNFTPQEKRQLIRLVRQRSEIVDSTGNLTGSNRRKRETWQKISDEFNAVCKSSYTRGPKELKSFWTVYKSNLRRKKLNLRDSEPDTDREFDLESYNDNIAFSASNSIGEVSDREPGLETYDDNIAISSQNYKIDVSCKSETSDDIVINDDDPISMLQIRSTTSECLMETRSKHYLHKVDVSDNEELMSKSSVKPKPRRKPNFTLDEKKQILQLARSSYKIIENNSYKASNILRKRVEWEKITKEFNKKRKIQRFVMRNLSLLGDY